MSNPQPQQRQADLSHPPRQLSQCHVRAAWSEESIENLRVEMCETVADWITTGWTPNIVNPEVRATLRSTTLPTSEHRDA